MSKKHHGGPAPVPPANQSRFGSSVGPDAGEADPVQSANPNAGASFEEQDPKRRLGDFETAGEHSRQQPGALNDGDTHSK
jgi:hypothetical protein